MIETFNNTKPFEGYSTVWGKALGCYDPKILIKNPGITSRFRFSNNTIKNCWTQCARQQFMFLGYAGLQNR